VHIFRYMLTISIIVFLFKLGFMQYPEGFSCYSNSPAFLTPGADVATWRTANTLKRVNPRRLSISFLPAEQKKSKNSSLNMRLLKGFSQPCCSLIGPSLIMNWHWRYYALSSLSDGRQLDCLQHKVGAGLPLTLQSQYNHAVSILFQQTLSAALVREPLTLFPVAALRTVSRIRCCLFFYCFERRKALQDKAMQRQTSTNQRDASGQNTGRSQGHLSSYLLGGALGERHRARRKTDSRGCDTHCGGPTQNLRSTGQETQRATLGSPGQTGNATMTRNQLVEKKPDGKEPRKTHHRVPSGDRRRPADVRTHEEGEGLPPVAHAAKQRRPVGSKTVMIGKHTHGHTL
jgi:hypothetical protein